mmetsp:Transcript_37153/g.93914  ORF Transcript_37153/g.93914 Transcript_37153/m.93914 type:complete len:222 (+) Transcript_37153:856-1521(+)
MVRRRLTRLVCVASVIFCCVGAAAAPGLFAYASSSSLDSSSLSPSSPLSSSSSSSSSPRISFLMASYSSSCCWYSGSTLNTSRPVVACTSESRDSSWVIWSSASTRSSEAGTAGCPDASKPALRTANRPSIMNCTRLSISPSCRMPRKRSNTEWRPCGDSSDRLAPTSLTKPTATSTLSSEGVSSSSISISSASSSCATCWFTRCPIILVAARHTALSLRL